MRKSLITLALGLLLGCNTATTQNASSATTESFASRLSASAIELTKESVAYDPAYFKITYPNGDVPQGKGVCTDVVIRAYRKQGIDLQRLVHEDMRANFSKYPKMWGLKSPDTNIDHRRVPNLMLFFERFGATLPITDRAEDYLAGDVVCWRLNSGATHIGVVTDRMNWNNTRPKIVHNIGWGQNLDDCLFDFKIIGHYRYPKNKL